MNADLTAIVGEGLSTPLVSALLPFLPQTIEAIREDGFLLTNGSDRIILWLAKGREASLARQVLWLKVLEQQEGTGFLNIVPLQDGRDYARLDNGFLFYLTRWLPVEPVSFHNPKHLQAVIRLVADFRDRMSRHGYFAHLSLNKAVASLPSIWSEAIERFRGFEMLARHRLHRSRFDTLFLYYISMALRQAETALSRLAESGYESMIAKLNVENVVLKNLSRGNLRISPSGEAVCLRLNECCWDLPFIDLAYYLINTGRPQCWNLEWFHSSLAEYECYFPVSRDEMDIIYAFIRFPWGFYRLASRYYLNLVDWPLRKMVEKLERLLTAEQYRIRLLEALRPCELF